MVASNIKVILDAALKLSPEDRAALADELWVSVNSKSQPEIDEAWEEEAERRVDTIEKGEVVLDDGEQVMRDIEKELTK